MERLGRWLWRRWRFRFRAALTVALISVGHGIVLPAIVLGSIIFGFSIVETFLALGAAAGFHSLGTTFAVQVVGRKRFDAVDRWIDGDRSNPEATSAVAFGIPREVIPPTSTVLLVPYVATITFVFSALSSEPWPAYALVAASAAITHISAAGVTTVSAELILRPLREEVAASLPGNADGPSPGWMTRPRLVFAVGLATFSGVTFGGTLAPIVDPVADRLLLILIVGILVALTNVAAASVFLLTPILRPVSDLQKGTERVAHGELDLAIPITSNDEFGELVATFNKMQVGLLERERLHSAFGAYVDPELAMRLLAQGDELFRGEEVDVTVFFVDVRDFTAYSERVQPREAVRRLNELFGLVVPILRDYGGHANKFSGDGLLAVFGVPEPLTDHADRAVAAALETQRRVAERFDGELRIGIGINSGRVIAGTVGGGGKLEFALIGDPVNVASRVEQLTKETGDPVLLTEATCDALSQPLPDLISRGAYALRGKAEAVVVYGLNLERGHTSSSG